MKSKIFIFIALILVGILFGITSCQDLNNSNSATITFNLDLSKILKTSRNENSQNSEYILKLFAYNAATYKPEDKIQNLPLLTQTENKVDINGNVKASLDIEIGLNVIFVAKLYQGKSEKPLYAGKSEVIKIKATDNKVHLVLTRENADLDIDILIHDHTFAEEWTKDETHHWYAATCEHKTEISEKAEHSFEWQVIREASCTEEGEKKATCTVCGYEKTEITDKTEHSYTNGICACGMREMALIPVGTFQMGSTAGYDDEKPVHEVTITKSFYMGKYEVTQAEYEKYCSYTGSSSPSSTYGAGDNYPAYYVSWYDALVYCNKRSIDEGLTPCYSISGNTDPGAWGAVPTSRSSDNGTWNAVQCDWNANGYRLPTEAEWEYAARAGDNTVDAYTYAGTRDESQLGEYAWYKSNSDNITHEVGKKLPNAFGLYDMSGNVSEWCWNWYTDSYDTGKEGGSNPTGASSGSLRVARGGSSFSPSYFCAVSNRSSHHPNNSALGIGFRVVRTATE